MIILVAAIAKNWAIGKNNSMLWHLPNDFKHFKNVTSGNLILMGRKTFESLPGVLPNRKHLIITKQNNYAVPEQCETYPTITSAIEKYKDQTIYIIGGGEIYKQTLPIADQMEITLVDEDFEDADAFFPEFNWNDWEITAKTEYTKDEKHKFNYTFLSLSKNTNTN